MPSADMSSAAGDSGSSSASSRTPGPLSPSSRPRPELRHPFRPEVVVAGRATKILIDQVRTIDVSYVAGELVDYLSRDDMAQVEHRMSRYLGLLR